MRSRRDRNLCLGRSGAQIRTVDQEIVAVAFSIFQSSLLLHKHGGLCSFFHALLSLVKVSIHNV